MPTSQSGVSVIPRTQSPVDDLATPESAARHPTMSHGRARRSSRPVFPLRTFRHLLQLVSQSPLSKMPGQCPPPLAGGAPPRVATHPLRACRFHSAAGTGTTLALQNKKVIYDLLFHASAETLLQVALDPKHLGAQIGFFSVLHTWDQKLQL